MDSRISHSCSHFGKILFTLGVTLVYLFVCLSVCLLLAKNEDFSSVLVSRFCYSVYLSTGHNSKPIVMKLYQVEEVVSTEKPIENQENRSKDDVT